MQNYKCIIKWNYLTQHNRDENIENKPIPIECKHVKQNKREKNTEY